MSAFHTGDDISIFTFLHTTLLHVTFFHNLIYRTFVAEEEDVNTITQNSLTLRVKLAAC